MEIESELYSIYCAHCGEEIKPGDKVVISDWGNSFDSLDCMREEEDNLEYTGPYNEHAVKHLNGHGKEESRIKK